MPPKAAVPFRDPHKVVPYAEALRAAAIEPLLISPGATLPADFDGLLLTGGTDVDPARYGQGRESETHEPDRERDAMEIALLEESLARRLPVFAICRGMQLFNVALGGTLRQHIANHAVRDRDVWLPVHDVEIAPDTLLSSILGPAPLGVNSRHHQALDRLGQGLRVSARSPADAVIEAVELLHHSFALAVQWHPEDQVSRDPRHTKLFGAFRDAMERERRAGGTEATVRGDDSVR